MYRIISSFRIVLTMDEETGWGRHFTMLSKDQIKRSLMKYLIFIGVI